jgi:hypothetical protein
MQRHDDGIIRIGTDSKSHTGQQQFAYPYFRRMTLAVRLTSHPDPQPPLQNRGVPSLYASRITAQDPSARVICQDDGNVTAAPFASVRFAKQGNERGCNSSGPLMRFSRRALIFTCDLEGSTVVGFTPARMASPDYPSVKLDLSLPRERRSGEDSGVLAELYRVEPRISR